MTLYVPAELMDARFPPGVLSAAAGRRAAVHAQDRAR